ncbi:MAG: serine protease [Methanothrix sp.]|jgi:hypothetical protein|uniref:S1 family peptidase n=1 Tax=Methanothrix sp. TaxID=90426 RepID=UPI00247E4373|nr:serine protease [Methanothrix sp.]
MRELIAKLKPSVGFVESGDSCGTGFLIKDDGSFLTCNHVLTGNNATVILGQREFPAEILCRCDEYDFAVLRLHAGNNQWDKILELGTFADVEEGDELLILGFPAGQCVLTAIRGMAAAKIKIKYVDAIKFDATVMPGLSGSPCIHVPSAKVIGVVSMQVSASAVLGDTLNQIKKLVRDADSLREQAKNTAADLEKRPGVRISGIDTNLALAYIFKQIENVAADFKAVGDSLDQFAKKIPLGMGYAISIDHYKERAADAGR